MDDKENDRVLTGNAYHERIRQMVSICTVPWWSPMRREDCVLLCLEKYLRPLAGTHGARDRPGERRPDCDWDLEQLSLRGLIDTVGVLHVSRCPR